MSVIHQTFEVFSTEFGVRSMRVQALAERTAAGIIRSGKILVDHINSGGDSEWDVAWSGPYAELEQMEGYIRRSILEGRA